MVAQNIGAESEYRVCDRVVARIAGLIQQDAGITPQDARILEVILGDQKEHDVSHLEPDEAISGTRDSLYAMAMAIIKRS